MAPCDNIKMKWSIITISKNNLSKRDKNIIADLINNESHIVIKKYGFILHDILEKKNSSEAIIEGKKFTAENIKKILKNTTDYEVICRRIED